MVICACPLGPVPGEPFETEGADTTATGASSAGETHDDPATTMGPGGPGPGPTTGEATSEVSAGSGGGDGSTTHEPPARCGPPCDSPWQHEGPMLVLNGGDTIDYSCMRELDGELFIGAGADPAQVATLANLERVRGPLTVAGNPQLTDLDALGCLREVEALKLVDMPQLADLGALAGLEVAPHVELADLGISALPAFAPGFAGVSSLTLRDNAALVDLHAASTWGPSGAPLELRLLGNPALPGLAGLAGLLADNGAAMVRIELVDLPALTSLAGLEPLVFASLHAERLPLVASLAPLANLQVGGQITFNAMPKVTDLAGLAALTSVGTFTVGDCAHDGSGGMDGLTSLAGLASLTKVQHLALADNDALTSLAGAPLLAEVAGFAAVGNPLLTPSDVEAFYKQVGQPAWSCHGGWDRCECAPINPG